MAVQKNKTLDGFIIPDGVPDYEDLDQLNQKVDDVFNRSSSYQKQRQQLDGSGDFSTLA